MGRDLGRYLEQRRTELRLSRRDVAERSQLSYPYVSQLENGDREPALKAMRALAPVLKVRVEDLAALVAGGEWSAATTSLYAAAPPADALLMSQQVSYSRDKVLRSIERRLRDLPPLERIALLTELIAQNVSELAADESAG